MLLQTINCDNKIVLFKLSDYVKSVTEYLGIIVAEAMSINN